MARGANSGRWTTLRRKVLQGGVAAGLLLGASLGAAAPAFAMCYQPCPIPIHPPQYLPRTDLVASMPQPGAPFVFYAGQPVTFQVTIQNNGMVAATDVPFRWNAVQTTTGLPASAAIGNLVSVNADSGFSCRLDNPDSVVTCSGGMLPANGVAHVTIVIDEPYSGMTATASVNADRSIAEWNYSNDTVTTSVT